MMRWFVRVAALAMLIALAMIMPERMRQYAVAEKNNRAVAALEAKRYDDAIVLLREAVRENPETTVLRDNLKSAYASKALQLARDRKDPEALDAFAKALEYAPDDQLVIKNFVVTINDLAVGLSNEHKYSESQELFEQAGNLLRKLDDMALRRDVLRNYSMLLTLWGADLMKTNKVEDAMHAFQQAIRLDPTNHVALIYIGDLQYEDSQYEAAKKTYTDALTNPGDNREYLNRRLEMIEDESRVEQRFTRHDDPNGRFKVYCVPYKGGVSIATVNALLNEAYDTIGKKLGIYPARTVSVKIYDTKDFFRISRLPEWAIGIFDGKIRMRVDDLQSAPNQVKDLIFHEYTHAVMTMNIKQTAPAWFHEGMAQLMEPQFAENPREQMQMRDALMQRRIDFSTLRDSFKDFDSKSDAETAYLLSKYFLAYLNRKHGEEKLVQWVQKLSGEQKFEDAFRSVYALDLTTAQNAWIQSLVGDAPVSGGPSARAGLPTFAPVTDLR